MKKQSMTLSEACNHDCPLRSNLCFSVDLALEKALSHLTDLGSATLMMKEYGLTTLSKIQLGQFHPCKNLLHDEKSGLKIDRTVQLIAFRCPLQDCFRIALTSLPDSGISYLGFDHIPWDSKEAQTLRTKLQCRPRELHEPCLQSCQRWLDDWTDQSSTVCHGFEKERIVQLITSSQSIEIEVSQGGIKRIATIKPHFLDADGDILRIRESGQRAIAIINMAQTKFAPTNLWVRISTK